MAEVSQEKHRQAVALAYDSAPGSAPRVVATGQGQVAEWILALAKEHDVSIVENRELVRTLIKLDPEQEIPVELYRAVAEVIAFVYRMKGSGDGSGGTKL